MRLELYLSSSSHFNILYIIYLFCWNRMLTLIQLCGRGLQSSGTQKATQATWNNHALPPFELKEERGLIFYLVFQVTTELWANVGEVKKAQEGTEKVKWQLNWLIDFKPPLFMAHFSIVDLQSVFFFQINLTWIKCFSIHVMFQNTGGFPILSVFHLSTCVSAFSYACVGWGVDVWSCKVRSILGMKFDFKSRCRIWAYFWTQIAKAGTLILICPFELPFSSKVGVSYLKPSLNVCWLSVFGIVLTERTAIVALQSRLSQKADLLSQMMWNDELSTGLRLLWRALWCSILCGEYTHLSSDKPHQIMWK